MVKLRSPNHRGTLDFRAPVPRVAGVRAGWRDILDESWRTLPSFDLAGGERDLWQYARLTVAVCDVPK